MSYYYDTGLLLKLYTEEPDSEAVRNFFIQSAEPIPFLALHDAECTSALHLKAFRGECSVAQANRALSDIAEDRRAGLLQSINPDWQAILGRTTQLAQSYAAMTGCRTLDTLHVACALELGYGRFVSSDLRQSKLAEHLGLQVLCPE
ncbi:MAG TPA: type II toxin-antitoxin system VapC family toxin [Opitutales bacterium]|nr:type II toxin-antitoxin system VapC family toxin [Opitutales bacterium]